MIEEVRAEQIRYVKKKRKNRRLRWLFGILLLMAAAGIFLFVQIRGNEHFETTYYTVKSEKIENPIRVAVLSDLHDREFGEGNSELIEAIRNEDVDLICMVGDMVNQEDGYEDLTATLNLCAELVEIAPVCYSRGNHENILQYSSEAAIDIDPLLEEKGVTTLTNKATEMEINGEVFCIGGVATTEEWWEKSIGERMEEQFFSSDKFKLLLCHYPNWFYEIFSEKDFDLAFAGHFHGGQIRLPILGGLYHPGGGFFPMYSGGKYQLSKGILIVSRGLGEDTENRSMAALIPRINNRPELIIVDIK